MNGEGVRLSVHPHLPASGGVGRLTVSHGVHLLPLHTQLYPATEKLAAKALGQTWARETATRGALKTSPCHMPCLFSSR